MSASSNAAADSSMQPMDVMIDDVHSRCAQVDEIMAQLRERCGGFITAATDKAKNIVEEAEKRTEAMREEVAQWEEEKARIATTHTFDQKIKLDIGGHAFSTTLATLTRFPDTMLGAMFSGRHALVKDENGAYFIDRNGRHFEPILDFLRAPEAYKQAPGNKGVKSEVEIEADYYGLKDLMFLGPSPAPLVKAASVTVTTHGGNKATVSQGDEGEWYMEAGSIIPRCLVTVCNTCGYGQPSIYPSSSYYHLGVPRFTTGRATTDAQPKKTGTCNWNGAICTCD
jgi:hypothetical protein